MRIRAAKREELTPKARERAMSPRQLAAMQREDEIRKALARLKSDDDIIAIELDPSDKIPTMRQAVKRAIAKSQARDEHGDPWQHDLSVDRQAARWAWRPTAEASCLATTPEPGRAVGLLSLSACASRRRR